MIPTYHRCQSQTVLLHIIQDEEVVNEGQNQIEDDQSQKFN